MPEGHHIDKHLELLDSENLHFFGDLLGLCLAVAFLTSSVFVAKSGLSASICLLVKSSAVHTLMAFSLHSSLHKVTITPTPDTIVLEICEGQHCPQI